ncbi:hypothetical protein [Mesorhizobium sp. ES1-4]|uniref:hypothetical protein n=1 Tax=Mesorhizobium sp. ES1-4 TaxID=2876627 RepID=UPI001CCC7C0E|nr:hypothetical protein [Mesorhizobium sp. ES1-4]MBZ9795589.1 hypothetical protein [Mesorhizobium sp. ES1-4]
MRRLLSRRALIRALSALGLAPALALVRNPPSEAATSSFEEGWQDVAPALMKAMCEHCAAFSDLGRVSRETNPVKLGRAATLDEIRRLDEASDLEDQLLLAVCRYPAGNDAERHDKATYLLGIFNGNQPETDLVTTILRSMTR